MARLTDQIAELEDQLDRQAAEIDRLGRLGDELENELAGRSDIIEEQSGLIQDLEAFEAFVEEQFPAAMEAWQVRKRMEQASGAAATVG